MTDKSVTLPSLPHGMLHAIETSDSNPESESDSDSDSDRVEGIVGSSSNSSELNDSGDQAADRQQLEQETIPESSTSRYGRKRT